MSGNDFESYLAKLPFFKGLGKEYIDRLCSHVKAKHLQAGDVVFSQDDKASSFFVIREGQVEVQIPSIYGAPIVVQTLGKNQVLGWSWLLPPYKWHFEARASQDSVILEFDGEALRKQCEEDARMGYELMKHFAALMADRVQAARMRVLEVCGPVETV